MIYIFDIDGTIADISHRLHYIESNPADWRAFYAACGDDKPIVEVIQIAKALQVNHSIHLITGRSEEIRVGTARWVNEQRIFFSELMMRKVGDHRQDSVVKSELLDELLAQTGRPMSSIAGVFEDRKQVVDMWRGRGLRVFQVADGDF